MRYKVMQNSDVVAGFETAQCAGDYLFTIPIEEISGIYVLDTNGEGFCFSTYKRTQDALTGAVYKTRIDAIGRVNK
jgi:hypothetical protein